MLHAIAPKLLPLALPIICAWAKHQEKHAFRHGIPLSITEQADAKRIGILQIDRVRLLRVDQMPALAHPLIKSFARLLRLDATPPIAISLGHAILIQSEHLGQRRIVVHELVHTHQFERLGGFKPFLRAYLTECLTVGYPDAPLEQEALRVEQDICEPRTNR